MTNSGAKSPTPAKTTNAPEKAMNLYRFEERWGIAIVEASSLDEAKEKRAEEIRLWGQ